MNRKVTSRSQEIIQEACTDITKEIEKIFQEFVDFDVSPNANFFIISEEIEKILDSIDRIDSQDFFFQEEKKIGQNLKKIVHSCHNHSSQKELTDAYSQARIELVRLQNAITKITERVSLQKKKKSYKIFALSFLLGICFLSLLLFIANISHKPTAFSKTVWTVQGEIVDENSKTISQSDIVFRSREGEIYIFQSDFNGKFHFTLPPGNYYAIVQAEGFFSCQKEISVQKNEKIRFVLYQKTK